MPKFSPEQMQGFEQWLKDNPLSQLPLEREEVLRSNLNKEKAEFARGERLLETDLETDREPIAKGRDLPKGELDKAGVEPEKIPQAIEESEGALDSVKKWISQGYISSRPEVTVLDEQVELMDMANYPGPRQRLSKMQCNEILAGLEKLLEYRLVEPETEIIELPGIVEDGISKLKRLAGH